MTSETIRNLSQLTLLTLADSILHVLSILLLWNQL